MNNAKQWQMVKMPAPPANGDLWHRDGHCLTGRRGTLAVVLEPEGFMQVRQSAAPTHWLIPVDDSWLVQAAASLPGEVLWLCRRHPATLLGQLEDGLRGAWLEADAVVVNLDGELQRFPLISPPKEGFALRYLAWVVAKVWTETASGKPVLPAINRPPTRPAALCAA